ncbi:MAG: prolipoprotein diacylglyceryl transferase [Bacteroidales bacterium]|jgi:phosphatidylglycerol:prolipoprotein diacylglycerol transferase|nr:prolipoprotein diacylglyceryl transferase [Bacteroidales bacterium]
MVGFIDWTVDPVAFEIGARGVRWYGILLATGFLLAYLVFSRIAKKEGVKQELVDRLAIFVVIGVIVGLRLGHCLFYNPSHYLQNPLDILKVWEGGLASHGGAIGIFLAVWLFQRKRKEFTFLYLIDRLSIIAVLAGSFVRIGNLINHEIVGVPTQVPWAFIFHRVDELPRHPTQLYEAIFYLLFFFALMLLYYKKDWGRREGLLTGLFFIAVFTFRFFIEFTKTVQMETGAWDFPLLMGQLLSIPFVLIGVWLMIRAFKRPKMKYQNE